MNGKHDLGRRLQKISGLGLMLGAVAIVLFAICQSSDAAPAWFSAWCHRQPCDRGPCAGSGYVDSGEWEGTWHWLRSPDQERRVVASLYTRYCVRCHGIDGRGVWDIPDVPDFTNARWQASRSDGQLARLIIEGRGAVMPPFRGTLNLDEAWALARYLRTLVPGTEVSRPDFGPSPQLGSGPRVIPPGTK